jgi:hypothetical protein
VQDLKYIATQAKLLLPMHDPSPRVWNGIHQSLYQQGLLPEDRSSLRGHIMTFPPPARSSTPAGWILATAALAAFSLLLVNYRPHLPTPQSSAQSEPAQPVALEKDDQLLIERVTEQAPAVGRAYEDSLREVNAYITDAQQAVAQDPEDAGARQQLVDAYQQKQMLYEMATSRTLP